MCNTCGIAHRDCAASVVTYILENSCRDIVLGGHSFGGTLAQKMVEELPGRIARTVFPDALILDDSHRVFDVLPGVFLESLKPKNGTEPAPAKIDDTMQTLTPARWEAWQEDFIQDAPESLARSTWQLLSPEPGQVSLDILDLKRFYAFAVPKSLIYCRQDWRCRWAISVLEWRLVLSTQTR